MQYINIFFFHRDDMNISMKKFKRNLDIFIVRYELKYEKI